MESGTVVRDQVNAIVLAPIFLILTVGMRNLIVKNLPLEKTEQNSSLWALTIQNNLHIIWILLVLNEAFSQVAFSGMNRTGDAIPEANIVWALIRTSVYLLLLLMDLWRWIKIKEKTSAISKVSGVLIFTELFAIYFALIFSKN